MFIERGFLGNSLPRWFMTITKLRQVLEYYQEWLETIAGVIPVRLDEEMGSCHVQNKQMLDHLQWMIEQCLTHLLSQELDLRPSLGAAGGVSPGNVLPDARFSERLDDLCKAMRWLGFIQGQLSARGFFSISQLRDHSREEDIT